MKEKKYQPTYTEAFKRMVVEEIENGVMTANEASRYYDINGHLTVYTWLSVYGVNQRKGKKVVIMSSKEETEIMTLKRELNNLRKELEEAEMREIAWRCMVEAIEEDLGIPIKKKPWRQALLEAKQQLYPNGNDSVSKDSARSTGSANKPGTVEKRALKRK